MDIFHSFIRLFVLHCRVGGPEASAITVWRRPRNASNVKIAGGGHLVSPLTLITWHRAIYFVQVVEERPKEVGK